MGELEQKEQRLLAILSELRSVAVAFSGGVDSTYLLAMCREAPGLEEVVAIVARSATLPERELQEAHSLAARLGVHLEVVETGECEDSSFVQNPINRCFYCQEIRIDAMMQVARGRGLAALLYGVTVDDMSDERPGIQAILRYGARMPLLDAELRKAEVRALSQRRGLPTHNKPSMACLASRIPYGTPITAQRLRQVEQAEAFLRQEIGLQQVRVRHHESVARLEIEADDMPRIVQPETRRLIVARLCSLGFTYVALDLAGFRSGSMNERLAKT